MPDQPDTEPSHRVDRLTWAEIRRLALRHKKSLWVANGVAVLAKQGSRYAPAGETQDALGLVEGMKVAGGVIELKTKWPAANDPRCCPSIAKTLRYRWSGGTLIPVK